MVQPDLLIGMFYWMYYEYTGGMAGGGCAKRIDVVAELDSINIIISGSLADNGAILAE